MLTGHAGAELGLGSGHMHTAHCCPDRPLHCMADQQPRLLWRCHCQWHGPLAAAVYPAWWGFLHSHVADASGSAVMSRHRQAAPYTTVYAGSCTMNDACELGCPLTILYSPDIMCISCDEQLSRHEMACVDLQQQPIASRINVRWPAIAASAPNCVHMDAAGHVSGIICMRAAVMPTGQYAAEDPAWLDVQAMLCPMAESPFRCIDTAEQPFTKHMCAIPSRCPWP